MAGRRKWLQDSIAIAVLLGGAPLAAQSTNNAATTATPPPAASTTPVPAPTPAPAPSGNAIGPPQLRDFNLGGTVTRPAETAAPPPANGTPRPPIASVPVTPPPAPRQRAAPAVSTPDSDVRADVASPPPDGGFPSVTPPVSTEVPLAPALVPEPATVPATDRTPDSGLWPWIAAGLALVLGGGFLLWRRQQHRPARYGADRVTNVPVAPRDRIPPAPRPAPRPVEPAARVPAATPVARPAPAPAPAPRPTPAQAPPPVAPAIPGGIVASGLKPRIELEVVPLRVEVDAAQGAAVTVEVVVHNRGSAPARDVLVEAHLVNAGPTVDNEVGLFFQRPPGSGQRRALIKPMGSVSVQLRLAVDAAGLAPLVIEGRKLLVPLVAVNAFYRWSGSELSGSASFLVGRGDSEAAKLAPFRLDQGARSWSSLAARLHSNGLQGR
jgi:hypothetical protein